MSSSGDVTSEVAWHGRSIQGHEDSTLFLAPDQEVGIRGPQKWCLGVPDAEDVRISPGARRNNG